MTSRLERAPDDASSRAFYLRPGGPVRRLAAILAVVVGLSSVVVHSLEFFGDERYSKDFALDYTGALALRDGANPYAPIKELIGTYLHAPPDVLERHVLPGANWHPPFKIIFSVPLSYLPFGAAAVLWVVISAICIVWAMVLFGSELGWRKRTSLLVGVAALALPVVQLELSAGNVDGPLLLLLVATWRFVRRRSDNAAGVALGVAAAVKVFPALFALPLLGMGRRRPVVVGAAVAIALTAVGLLGAGLSTGGGHLDALRSEGYSYWLTSPANLSIWGLITRWLVPNGWVDGGDADILGKTLAAVAALACVGLALRPPSGRTKDPFWAAAPLILLAWPVTWNQYLIFAVPWVFLALHNAAAERSRLLPVVAVVGAAMMLGFPPGLSTIEGVSEIQVALGYQLPTFALIAAVGLEFAGSRAPVSATATPSGAPQKALRET